MTEDIMAKKGLEWLVVRFKLNWTNFIGAIIAVYSVDQMFWQGVLAGALLLLGRAGIDLAHDYIERH